MVDFSFIVSLYVSDLPNVTIGTVVYGTVVDILRVFVLVRPEGTYADSCPSLAGRERHRVLLSSAGPKRCGSALLLSDLPTRRTETKATSCCWTCRSVLRRAVNPACIRYSPRDR